MSSTSSKPRGKDIEKELERIETEQSVAGLTRRRHTEFKELQDRRLKIMDSLVTNMKEDEIKQFSAEELELIVNDLADRELIREELQPLATTVSEQVNFAPTDTHWLAGKAVDFILGTGAVVLGGVLATRVLPGVLGASVSPRSEEFVDSHPFADTTATPRPGSRRRENVVPFDSKAG